MDILMGIDIDMGMDMDMLILKASSFLSAPPLIDVS